MSLRRACNGFLLDEVNRTLKKGNIEQARGLIEDVHGNRSGNPESYYAFGQTAFDIFQNEKKYLALEIAISSFETLVEQVPSFAMGWLYLGLTRLADKQVSGQGVTEADWKEIKPLLLRAYANESANSWLGYRVATTILSFSQWENSESFRTAVTMIKRSIANDDIGPPYRYLEPAFSFLWSRFMNFSTLKDITPLDEAAYLKLIQFIDEKGLWKYREEIFDKFLKLNEDAYTQKCNEAEKWLYQHHFRQAFRGFQEAFWINRSFVRAKAGLLISQEELGERGYQDREWLREVLEDEEEKIGLLLPRLEKVISKSEDFYIKGLYAFLRRQWGTSRLYFEKVEKSPSFRFQRRYLAATYWQLGEKAKAYVLLQQSLTEEEVDMRELLLFKTWDTPYQEDVLKKIERMRTRSRSAEDWWGWTKDIQGLRHRLDQPARMGVTVNLFPGAVRFRLMLKSSTDKEGNYGFLLLRLCDAQRERIVDSLYIGHDQMRPVTIELKSSGGYRWFEAELANGSDLQSKPGPSVEFGPLVLEYLDEN